MLIKTFEKPVTGTEIFQINWKRDYLKSLNDTEDVLVSFASDPGITVVSMVSVGNVVPGGVLLFRASGGTLGQKYKVKAVLRTVNGREKPAEVEVEVVAD